MEYEVEREDNQYHIRAKGQVERGTTLTDIWLKERGFWPLSRLNIDAAINATYAMVGGISIDRYAETHVPKDIELVPSSRSYRPRIPERMLFRADA